MGEKVQATLFVALTDPCAATLTCSPGEVAALPKYHLNLKLDIITMAYNDKAKIEKPRPQPDIAEFVKTADVKSLSSRPEEMALIDKHMQTIRLEAQKQLESSISSP